MQEEVEELSPEEEEPACMEQAEVETVEIEEIQEEWIQPNSMAMFEDYSEQFSDDFPNLNQ